MWRAVICICLCLLGAASANTKGCGKKETEYILHFGRIISHEGYSRKKNYPNNLNCTWSVSASHNQFVRLRISSLFLQDSRNCISDSLTIFDGPDIASPVIHKLCGRREEEVLHSSGQSVSLRFITDGSVTGKGFKVFYSFRTIGEIGANEYSTVRRLLPRSLYEENGVIRIHQAFGGRSKVGRAEWMIVGRHGKVVHLRFEYFYLQSDCSDESLTIYDGKISKGSEIVRLCGSILPGDISSTNQSLTLRFESLYNFNEKFKGFTIRYNLVRSESPLVPHSRSPTDPHLRVAISVVNSEVLAGKKRSVGNLLSIVFIVFADYIRWKQLSLLTKRK